MATQINNYQCPSCTGPLHFHAATGKLQCEYCDSSYEVAEIEAYYKKKEEEAEKNYYTKEEIDTYLCPSCGAQLLCDKTTAATQCPYCGNPSIVPGKFQGLQKPDYIIPFQKTKEEAIMELHNFYKRKPFLPKEFKSENHIMEMKGVYVPFWLMDGTADGDIHYQCTRSHQRRSGNYMITTTDHFHVHRKGTLRFEKIPVDASSKMPDGHMDSIEPFNYADLKKFSTAYLPGFLAEQFDVKSEDCFSRLEERCEKSIASNLRNTVHGYETCVETAKEITVTQGKVQYALMPVWMLATKWKEGEYLFAMNGQTGHMVGNLPISWKKFWITFFTTFLSCFLLLMAFSIFRTYERTGSFFAVSIMIPCLISAGICFYLKGLMKTIGKQDADAYQSEQGIQLQISSDHFTHQTHTKVKIESKNK